MPVSQREFFDNAYWKLKRYNNVIAQAGKDPADFEFVEMQDMLNYEQQQLVDNLVNCGFLGDGFKVFQAATPATNSVRIYKGRGWVQAGEPTTGGPEYSGIRLELPDVLTNYPTLDYEHALTGDYYVFNFTASNPTGIRYDLIYVKFYRQEYTPSEDGEMQDSVLGETATREKWYYEFVYQEGDGSTKNPDIAGLSTGEHGVKLAVVVRNDNEVIVDGPTVTSPYTSIWDMRPKFSTQANLLNAEMVTVGKDGGEFQNIFDVFPSTVPLDISLNSTCPVTLPFTPAADTPYVVKLMAGLHTCPYQVNINTAGYIRICGDGVEKTILEFDDLYSLFDDNTPWINIGSHAAGASIEFSDMTIRIKNGTYATNNWLVKVYSANSALPGVVKFTNCRIGDLGPSGGTTMEYGGIYAYNGQVTLTNCEVNTRSADKQAIFMTQYSQVKIEGSRVRQSNYIAVQTDTTVNGTLEISSSEIVGNDQLLYLNGINSATDVNLVKEEWNTGDAVTSGDLVYVFAPTDFSSVYMTGPVGQSRIWINYSGAGEVNFFGCKHDDTVLCDTSCTVNFMNCLFVVTTAVDVITVSDTCEPSIQNCNFRLGHASARAVYVGTSTTAIPAVTHCTFLGDASYLFGGVAGSTLSAGFLAAPSSMSLQNGANIDINSLEIDLPIVSFDKV